MSAGTGLWSMMRDVFSTTSQRLASAQHAIRAVSTFASRIAAMIGGRPPFFVMSTLFSSAKLSVQMAGITSTWISGSSVRARYRTGSRPPSSVTCFRTSEFWATLTRA